jgi:hypothetical protein
MKIESGMHMRKLYLEYLQPRMFIQKLLRMSLKPMMRRKLKLNPAAPSLATK